MDVLSFSDALSISKSAKTDNTQSLETVNGTSLQFGNISNFNESEDNDDGLSSDDGWAVETKPEIKVKFNSFYQFLSRTEGTGSYKPEKQYICSWFMGRCLGRCVTVERDCKGIIILKIER